jgi:hypothetical protein
MTRSTVFDVSRFDFTFLSLSLALLLLLIETAKLDACQESPPRNVETNEWLTTMALFLIIIHYFFVLFLFSDLVTGYFGLWTICKDLPQGRSFCGLNITAFNLSSKMLMPMLDFRCSHSHRLIVLSAWTFIAGVIAVVSVISLGLAALLGVCLLLMLKTQERVCLPYRPAVVARLVLSALAGTDKDNQVD